MRLPLEKLAFVPTNSPQCNVRAASADAAYSRRQVRGPRVRDLRLVTSGDDLLTPR